MRQDNLQSASTKSKQSKEKIFSNLKDSGLPSTEDLKPPEIKLERQSSSEENLKTFVKNLEENKAFVFHATASDIDANFKKDHQQKPLKEVIEKIIEDQKIKNCFVGKTLTHLLKDTPTVKPSEKYFAEKEIYNLEAAITHAQGGVADVGALAIVPNNEEPRSITLIPPIHIVVVDKKNIFTTVDDFLSNSLPSTGNDPLPTNIVFVSGPSKTADLVGKLCFGIHGPKKLYVIINHS